MAACKKAVPHETHGAMGTPQSKKDHIACAEQVGRLHYSSVYLNAGLRADK